MMEQIGKSHLTVLDAIAQRQIGGNVHTNGWVRKSCKRPGITQNGKEQATMKLICLLPFP